MKKPNIVRIEVMTPDNKSVQQRYRFVAEDQDGKTKGVTFTPEGVDHIINTFVTKFEMASPGHHYRLVEFADARFRLVWGDHAQIKKSLMIPGMDSAEPSLHEVMDSMMQREIAAAAPVFEESRIITLDPEKVLRAAGRL